jgi:CHRD domain
MTKPIGTARLVVAIAALVAACSSNSTQPVKVTLGAQPTGTATLTWDPQTKNVTAKVQLSGVTPGSTHAMHIHKGPCTAMGDILVPFPDLTADTGGAINTTVTGTQPAPDGLTTGTSLNMHLGTTAQLGTALGFTPIACGDVVPATPTTVTLAPVGQQPQGSADMTYDPGKKTLTVTTTASGLAPGSSHAQHIHLGSCAAQGEVKYGLDDLVASPTGTAEKTTVVPNAEAPPASGWYLNVHLGSSSQILDQNGNKTLYFQPIICANIGK